MKRSKVVAFLMSGLIALSQPVSFISGNLVYAEETEESLEVGPINETQETVQNIQEEPMLDINETQKTEIQITDNISQEPEMEGPMIADEDSEAIQEAEQTEPETVETEPVTCNLLSWAGFFSAIQKDVNIEISYDDGTEMLATDLLEVKELTGENQTALELEIQNQMIASEVSSIFGLQIKKTDENGNEKENGFSYKIRIYSTGINKTEELRLYRQRDNGSIEELSYIESVSDGRQYLEFVSAEGLGNFLFVNVVEQKTENETEKEESEYETLITETEQESQSNMPESDTESESERTTETETESETPHETETITEPETESESDTEKETETTYQPEEETESETETISEQFVHNTNVAQISEPDKNSEETGSDAEDAVAPIIIDEFHVNFVNGADKIDEKNVWNPSDSIAGHSFIYRVDYTMSGKFSTDIGAFKIEVPLHILKDKDGNWADTFSCPYWMRSEVSDGENPDFVYEIDEENNKAYIYNYKEYPTGEAGYIEFAYVTTKNTTEYMDMGSSTKVNAKVYATNENSTVTREDEANEVYIDTHATIAYTQKKQPTLYTSWNDSWGEKPEGADNYLYLIWPIRTYINKNTSAYNFSLNDNFTDLNGEVEGYKLAGQTMFHKENHIDNITSYGDRYDYVLTKYLKSESEKKLQEIVNGAKGYYVYNEITATVSPVDHVDEDTTADSSFNWWYRAPAYTGAEGVFWAEKYGIYGDYSIVYSSEDVSNYTLGEFEDGDLEELGNLKYYIICNNYPYPYTLSDEADGTVNDALNGLYGQKKVDYTLIDDSVDINGTVLEDADYNIVKAELSPVFKTAVFNEATYEFEPAAVTKYEESDNINVFVRDEAGWHLAAVYNVAEKRYQDIDTGYIKNASGRKIEFQNGIKGIKYECSNAYYYTRLIAYPEISLQRTDHILEMLKNDPQKIIVTNYIDYKATQGENNIFKRETKGSDYVQKVNRESEIKKDITQTTNIKKESRFEVTWNIAFKEKYVDDSGTHYIYQNGGKFYDLLPLGCDLNVSTVLVTESGNMLTRGDYEYQLINDYRGSGRTLLIIDINNPTKNEYGVQYITSHTYDSINDYGRSLLNSVAYESGNNRIGEGLPDDGGNITDKSILKDLDPDTDAPKFAYAEARYEVDFPIAASTGLKKQIKNSTSKIYSYNEVIHKGEEYSYQIRLANDASTKAKNIIFLDSLENFYQDAGQDTTTIASDWHGTLTGIDTTQLTYKGASPVIYLSKMKNMNPQKHNDLTEADESGNPVWIESSQFISKYGIEEATAIAVDISKKEDGSDFILMEQESLSFFIYMKAPDSDTSGKQDPVTCNNIFVSRTAIKESGNDIIEFEQFYHQDYTQAHYRISADVFLQKLDATDEDNYVSGAVYRLSGISDYGTYYEQERISNKDGRFDFYEVEKGTYELKEIKCSDDWQLDTNTYTVIVDAEGNVLIEGLDNAEDIYICRDKPRTHADIIFQKIDNVTNGMVEGATFRLTGTSDYGNEYTLYAVSNKIGRVSFKNIELGTYELVEVEAPDGYIRSKITWTVKINESGIVSILNGTDKIQVNKLNMYQIENEPYHSIRFLKSSTYGDNIYLEGAEFSLIGVSEYGTKVNKKATSGKAEDGGLVIFDGLEPGTYTLKETKAPDGHYINEKPYTVIVQKDGTFTIDGLEKTVLGN